MKWPKSRPPMSDAVQTIYQDNYVSNRSGEGLINRVTMALEKWMHRQVAKQQNANETVLEIGPGNLNHATYIKSSKWDVVEPYDPLYEAGSQHQDKVNTRFRDISETTDGTYDRIYSIAVMEHICDLPDLLQKSRQSLKPGGTFQAAIPSEGGFLWRLMSWHIKGFFFWLKYKKDYKEIMLWEHVNNSNEIIEEIFKEFGNSSIKRFPPLGPHLSLYTYVEAKNTN